MNKETRIKKIEQIVKRGPSHGEQDILWHNRLELMRVYEIPLECLIYNQYNGRILSRTLSLEKSSSKINPTFFSHGYSNYYSTRTAIFAMPRLK